MHRPWATQRGGDRQLTLKPFDDVGEAREVLVNDLERDDLARREICGAVHAAHAPLSEPLLDLETAI
jgi:hypothetical protein